MKRGILLAAAISIGAQPALARAQATAAPATPAIQDPQSTVAAAPVATAQDQAATALRRRNQIQMMEGVLTRAVRSGAEDLARRMQSRDPSLMLFAGQARARGFVLEGYGIFFDVEIPALRPTVVWAATTLARDATIANAIDSLAQALAVMPDGPARVRAQQALKHVQQLNPGQGQAQRPLGMPRPDAVQSLAVEPAVDDPHTSYTEAVKNALIDAMLDYSLPMDLAPDEWLTVAARDSEGPLTPDEIYDASTILLRVKGSDLATYAADRNKRSEVRGRVKVTQF